MEYVAAYMVSIKPEQDNKRNGVEVDRNDKILACQSVCYRWLRMCLYTRLSCFRKGVEYDVAFT